jgi:hypothetical protein
MRKKEYEKERTPHPLFFVFFFFLVLAWGGLFRMFVL